MSGPFRFNQEPARSPLDRSASPFSSGQPVSFKTNVNRSKTKKWVQAKKNAYDGDDWGEYDEYDEYGVNNEPPLAQPQSAQRYYAQRIEQPSRSFTDPSHQAPLPKPRRNSFEHGEEQRAFSSTIPYPQQGYGQYDESRQDYGQSYGEPQRQPNSDQYDQGYEPQDRRDFSPSALPHPLQTRISQVPADFTSPSNTQFPPRKSSIGQVESPVAASPRPRTGSQSDKPLPFIRPADIYRRHQEEQQRASLDSSRPSLDSLSSRPKDDVVSPNAESAKSLQPMETVAERKSEYLPNFDPADPANHQQQHQSEGPFDDRLWSSGLQSQASANHPSTMSAADDQGFRSVVDQAFTRTDDQRSVPPTPISNDSSSDLLRSNTGSTSGISPIMSRVPSSATSALKNRNQAGGEGSTPAIAEEPSETMTSVSRPTSTNITENLHHLSQNPSQGRARNFSSSSTPRSGLATPTRGDSPARSPALAPQRIVPGPKTALFTTESNESTEAMVQGDLEGRSPAYATREADIANAMRENPTEAAPELSAAEMQSQDAFLDSHNAQSPIQDTIPRDRSESPSKGRVQALAGKFGEVSQSRRGSTQSNLSRNSIQSWEKSNNHSRAASPTKYSPGKPSSPAKEFRPHLPGQWESYATTAMTPSEHGEQERDLSLPDNNPNSLERVDLTPTTVKRPVADMPRADDNASDPISALKNAGAAMVESIRTTVGLEDGRSDTEYNERGRVNHGDVYSLRPLQLDRTVSAISSAPPTPPAKDTPASEFPPPPPLKEKTLQASLPFTPPPKRPSLDPQLSTDPSAEDQESDRLRKEIVASLSPVRTSTSPAIESTSTALQPDSSDPNRASSILPSEYDTYWADEDRLSPRMSQDTERKPSAAPSSSAQTNEDPRPVVLNRFSWEDSNSQLQTPDGRAGVTPVADSTKSRLDEGNSSATVQPVVQEERERWSKEPQSSYFGPGHTLTITEPEPIKEQDLEGQPSTPPLDSTRSLTSPTRERTRSPGLHVVNTENDPEAVDLPPRFSAEHHQVPEVIQENALNEKQAEPETPHPATASFGDVPKTPTAQDFVPKSPISDKPLGAREIATINSTSERIATYNKTRDHWATTDHGLEDWLTSTMQANPDLATPAFPAQRPPVGSARHRHTGSLALFGKLGGSSSHDQGSEQPNVTGIPAPAGANSPTTAGPSGSGFGGRNANQQMQLKGKDLLHTANVLSGKGMTSAKGFFAKGKSRFGREKVEK